jgi:hypothetical protein
MELLVPSPRIEPTRLLRSLRLRLASGSGAIRGVVAARPAACLMRQPLYEIPKFIFNKMKLWES